MLCSFTYGYTSNRTSTMTLLFLYLIFLSSLATADYNYIGCYDKDIIQSLGLTSKGWYMYQSVSYCQLQCGNSDVVALLNGGDCYCGSNSADQINSILSVSSSSDGKTCNVHCNGWPYQSCGGTSAIDLYVNAALKIQTSTITSSRTTSTLSSSSTSTTTSTTSTTTSTSSTLSTSSFSSTTFSASSISSSSFITSNLPSTTSTFSPSSFFSSTATSTTSNIISRIDKSIISSSTSLLTSSSLFISTPSTTSVDNKISSTIQTLDTSLSTSKSILASTLISTFSTLTSSTTSIATTSSISTTSTTSIAITSSTSTTSIPKTSSTLTISTTSIATTSSTSTTSIPKTSSTLTTSTTSSTSTTSITTTSSTSTTSTSSTSTTSSTSSFSISTPTFTVTKTLSNSNILTTQQISYITTIQYSTHVTTQSIVSKLENNQTTIYVTATSVQQIVTYTSTLGISSLNRDPSASHHKLTGGSIAGIVVGIVCGVLLLAGILFFLLWRRRKTVPNDYTEYKETIQHQPYSFGETEQNATVIPVIPNDLSWMSPKNKHNSDSFSDTSRTEFINTPTSPHQANIVTGATYDFEAPHYYDRDIFSASSLHNADEGMLHIVNPDTVSQYNDLNKNQTNVSSVVPNSANTSNDTDDFEEKSS